MRQKVKGLEPEEINDHKKTTPARRIQQHFQRYQKPLHGSLVAQEVGLDAMRARCPHFARWLDKLERLQSFA